jgi:hypothetical protein
MKHVLYHINTTFTVFEIINESERMRSVFLTFYLLICIVRIWVL